MLVLSRKVGESLIIDGDIKVKILEVRGNRIRIGIEAPPDVNIVRDELLDRDTKIEKPVPAVNDQC